MTILYSFLITTAAAALFADIGDTVVNMFRKKQY